MGRSITRPLSAHQPVNSAPPPRLLPGPWVPMLQPRHRRFLPASVHMLCLVLSWPFAPSVPSPPPGGPPSLTASTQRDPQSCGGHSADTSHSRFFSALSAQWPCKFSLPRILASRAIRVSAVTCIATSLFCHLLKAENLTNPCDWLVLLPVGSIFLSSLSMPHSNLRRRDCDLGLFMPLVSHDITRSQSGVGFGFYSVTISSQTHKQKPFKFSQPGVSKASSPGGLS